MQRRQITLEDGRYLIFYTFAGETAAPPSSKSGEVVRAEESAPRRDSEPRRAEPQATEEPGRV